MGGLISNAFTSALRWNVINVYETYNFPMIVVTMHSTSKHLVVKRHTVDIAAGIAYCDKSMCWAYR